MNGAPQGVAYERNAGEKAGEAWEKELPYLALDSLVAQLPY